MKKTNLKIAVTGLAISVSLLSATTLAIAKPRIGEVSSSVIQQQTYSFKPAEDLFVIDTKFRVNFAKETKTVQTVPQEITKSSQIKKEIPKPKRISVKTSTKSKYNQIKIKNAKKELKQSTPKVTTSLRQTRNKVHTLETSAGNNIKYSRLIPVKATAYTAAAEENGKWGAYDYFGNPLKIGTIAVDPDVIPMGSTVYITGYTFDGLPSKGMIAKATDQGSAIQGKRVDIFVPSSRADASKFGMQDVKIYILK